MKPAIFIKPRRKTLGFQPWGASQMGPVGFEPTTNQVK